MSTFDPSINQLDLLPDVLKPLRGMLGAAAADRFSHPDQTPQQQPTIMQQLYGPSASYGNARELFSPSDLLGLILSQLLSGGSSGGGGGGGGGDSNPPAAKDKSGTTDLSSAEWRTNPLKYASRAEQTGPNSWNLFGPDDTFYGTFENPQDPNGNQLDPWGMGSDPVAWAQKVAADPNALSQHKLFANLVLKGMPSMPPTTGTPTNPPGAPPGGLSLDVVSPADTLFTAPAIVSPSRTMNSITSDMTPTGISRATKEPLNYV